MAYVFNKINSLVSNQGSSGSGIPTGGSTAISGASPSQASSDGANPTASTFKNPSTLIQRNMEANTGAQTGLNTTQNLNKDVQNQSSGLQGSNQAFEGQMQKTRQGFDFNQNDVQNADKARLAPILNPDTASIGNAQGTNVNNYNADIRGVRALGSDEGTRAQLKNQYGYGVGSSALDSMLYRGSGQAGKDIRQAQNDLQGLNAMKQSVQGSEATSRQNTINYANQRSNELKGALTAQQAAVKNKAEAQAQAANAQNQALLDAQKAKLTAAGVNLNQTPMSLQAGNAEGYLDPSFNRIAELLGTQTAGPGVTSKANYDQAQIDQAMKDHADIMAQLNTPDPGASDRLIQEGRDKMAAQEERSKLEAMKAAQAERDARNSTWYGQPLYAAQQGEKFLWNNGVAPTIGTGIQGTQDVWNGVTGAISGANRGFEKIGKLF